jgi:hypothetical protein
MQFQWTEIACLNSPRRPLPDHDMGNSSIFRPRRLGDALDGGLFDE